MPDNTKKRSLGIQIRNLIVFGIGICFIVFLFIHLNQDSSISNLIEQISILKIGFICFTGFSVNTVSIAVTQLYMVKSFGCRMGFYESLALSIVSRSGNTLTPFRLGTIYRIVYLKQNHDLLLLQFGSMFLGLQLVLILTGSFVSGAVLTILSFTLIKSQFNLALLFFLISFICIVFITRPLPPAVSRSRIGKKLLRFLEGWQLLQQDKKVFWIAIGGRGVSLVINAMLFYLIFHNLGEKVDWLICLLFSSISSLTMLIQIIPGSMGITESAVTFLALFFSLSSAVGFSSSLLIRMANILFLIVLVLPSWLFLEKLRHNIPRQKST